MNKTLTAALWGLAVALYLGFGLEATGWLFYEATHITGVEWLYWGYSGFRGAAYVFSLWDYQAVACIAAGVLIFVVVAWRARHKAPEVPEVSKRHES